MSVVIVRSWSGYTISRDFKMLVDSVTMHMHMVWDPNLFDRLQHLCQQSHLNPRSWMLAFSVACPGSVCTNSSFVSTHKLAAASTRDHTNEVSILFLVNCGPNGRYCRWSGRIDYKSSFQTAQYQREDSNRNRR